ncbi:Gp15 family bacteriophage protein [Latilactobacillus curvatus]|uniref:Gp15 family bacteriophage protein n=1 Tax=Latilactobacillus curvatus TaxID=28038 RepID=UPI0024DF3142|nr:Gp15 family bacteriophage protein [Latilactobacillus curvatus]WIE01460.1 Gp15 family bacteriophage protein [Latilactobacillus curvatus]
MFKLNDPLDDCITISGIEHKLNMAFDNVMDALEALADKEMTEIDRIDVFLEIMVSESADDLDLETKLNTVNDVIEHINHDPIESQPIDLNGNPMPVKKSKDDTNLISFSLDAKYIYAAFVQAYNIDLIEQQGVLHWAKFSALLNTLPDTTLMRQIIDIRKTKLSEIKDKDERKRIKMLKKQFALPSDELEEGGEMYG